MIDDPTWRTQAIAAVIGTGLLDFGSEYSVTHRNSSG